LLERFMRRSESIAGNAINAANSDLQPEDILELAKSNKNGAAFEAL